MKILPEVDKLAEKMLQYRRLCTKCGHSMIITPKLPTKICRWCGTMNYYDEK